MLIPLSIPSFQTRIHHMSLLELLFALLLVCMLAATVVVAALVWNLLRRSEGQAREVAELRGRLEVGGSAQDTRAAELRERLTQTQSVVEGMRSALTARQAVEDDARASLRRLENVIAVSSTRGAAGENILEEALRHLPPEMLQRNVWVGGKVVELALRLPGGKLLPMDSKWVSSGALEQLADPALDAPRRAQLTNQVERYGEGKQVSARIRASAQSVQVADKPEENLSTDSTQLTLVESVH